MAVEETGAKSVVRTVDPAAAKVILMRTKTMVHPLAVSAVAVAAVQHSLQVNRKAQFVV
jgi:hypothetical protein